MASTEDRIMPEHTGQPLLTAICFVAAAAMLAGIVASLMPANQVVAYVEASSATEAGLDLASVGYLGQSTILKVATVSPTR
jgi:hypothetical protein